MKLLFFVSKMGPPEKCRPDVTKPGSTVWDPSLGQKKHIPVAVCHTESNGILCFSMENVTSNVSKRFEPPHRTLLFVSILYITR